MRGFPHFCISIACIQNNKLQHALILDPIRGDEFTATKGGGAQLNDTRIRVGKSTSLEKAVISLSSASGIHSEKNLKLQEKLAGKVGGLRVTGSSALDLAYVAAGRLDAGWMSGMQKWDTAAGILLVQEAGGLISDASGNPDCLDSDTLIFANQKCFKQLLKVVSEI
jgi:myo-inositol-1(or 4)-monophosphatase